MNLKKHLPILTWLPNYKKHDLAGDLSAGFTVGVMLIPQGMAYAMIAGLPPVYGLYAAMIPQVIYAIFGTSRQLAVGPVAMDSLLVAAGISVFAVAGSEHYIALALLLSFMMGMVQLAFGVFRLGFLVNFLSKPVISGFTSAAAIIIGINQLRHLTGISLGKSDVAVALLWNAVNSVEYFNWISIAVGVVGMLIIKYSKRLHKAIPGALVAVVFGVLVVRVGQLELDIVGNIPVGFPEFKMPNLQSTHFNELIPIALTLALIAFMEAISVAKAIQEKHKGEYSIDNNQELIGLGMSNVVGSFFGAYPTTGGFSRSAVNDQAGARTNLAAIFSALLIALTLLFLTPLFYYLPQTILAAIILIAVAGLVDFSYPKLLWATSKQDFLMLSVAFLVTFLVGIKEGIGAGVLMSLVMLIYRAALPHIAILGRLPGTTDYRNIKRFDDIEIRKDVLVLRHDGQLFFANTAHFLESLRAEAHKKGDDLRLIVLHCGSVSHIDATALQALKEVILEYNEKHIQVALSGVIGPVRDFLHRTKFVEEFGEDKFFLDIQSAIDYLDNPHTTPDVVKFKRAVQANTFGERVV